jgi:hypothetical protein
VVIHASKILLSIRYICFLLVTICSQQSLAIDFISSVDRNQIAEGESIILTVKYNSNVFSGDPDFAPLQQQFDVINTSRKNNFQYINGRSESWTIWNVALIPKRKGNLVLPSLTFKGQTTKPIQISVSTVSADIKNNQKDVFFHTEVDVTTAYVQSQVLYTEKLYFSVPLENSQLGQVIVDEAVVQALGEIKHYRTQLNGMSYEVYERKSLIFPQTSGELIIPGPIYSGEISNGRWRGGRPIQISHGPISIPVLPKPASYPDGTWLPAQEVKIDYKWRGNTTQLKVGEPITLELKLTANGLTSAQLPDLQLPKVKGLKYYPDQAQTNDTNNNSGVMGSRTQSIAFVPTQAGTFTLPEIRLPWWDTKESSLKYSVLPAQQLTALSVSGPNNTAEQSVKGNTTSESAILASNKANNRESEELEFGLLWPILSACFGFLWLFSTYMWMQTRSVSNPLLNSDTADTLENSRANLKAVKQACRANDPAAARIAILNWAKIHWANSIKNMTFVSLDQVAHEVDDSALETALNELDYTLYSQTGNSAWQGENLWQIFSAYKIQKKSDSSTLTSLYPLENSIN